MLNLLRTKYGWLINIVFFAVCVMAGALYELGIAAVGLVFLFLFFAWMLQASATTRAVTALSICLFMGFFHAPITTTRSIFFLQDALIIVTFVAVLLGRHSQPFSVPLTILFPIFIFVAVSMPLSLLDFDFLIVMNGLRKWLLPFVMFFLAQLVYQEGMEKKILKLLLWAVVIQVPASLFIGALYSGGSFIIRHADDFTGTFGRGGTTVIAVLVPPTVIWGILAAWSGDIKKPLAVGALGAFGILVALCEIKFALFIMPMMFTMLMLLNFVVRKNLKKVVLNPIALIIPALTLALLLGVGDKFITYEKHGTGFVGGLDAFEVRDLERYLGYDKGGIRHWFIAEDQRSATELTRYGMLVATLEQASKSPRRLILGYGLDSVVDNAMQESLLKIMARVDLVAYQVFSFLLFETGLLGLIAYLTPVLYFFFLSLELFVRPPPGVSYLLVSGVLLFTFTALATILYNDILRYMNFGGVLWFLCGMLYAHRSNAKKAALEQG